MIDGTIQHTRDWVSSASGRSEAKTTVVGVVAADSHYVGRRPSSCLVAVVVAVERVSSVSVVSVVIVAVTVVAVGVLPPSHHPRHSHKKATVGRRPNTTPMPQGGTVLLLVYFLRFLRPPPQTKKESTTLTPRSLCVQFNE